MAGFLDAVIVDGPNKGKTIRECIAQNFVRDKDAPADKRK